MLNIYYGRESINKEKFVYSRIAARGYSAQRPVLVIVPDQYTLEAERQAFRFSGIESLLGLDVYSMSRLGHAILEEMGGDRETFIDRYGRQMLLTRIAREEEESLNVFRGNMKRNAFISLTNDFISELKQYGLAPDDLAAVRDAVPSDRLLHRKLSDLTRIYERYQAEIEGKYTDSEDYIDLYIGKIGSSRYVRNASVWVYGFDSFAPKSLKVLGGLMAAAEDVNVVMTADRQCRDEALFSLAWTVIGMLKKLGIRVPEDVQVIGFDGIRMFGEQEYVVSTIVQPVQEIAEACVSTVLSKHLSNVPSLICLPVTYAYGGTTRE